MMMAKKNRLLREIPEGIFNSALFIIFLALAEVFNFQSIPMRIYFATINYGYKFPYTER